MKLLSRPPTDTPKPAEREEEVVINEIIVPLPQDYGPQQIYARIGTNIVSHTKFSPLVFKELIQEQSLKLRDIKAYKEY